MSLIHIALASDDNFAVHMGTLICSLQENNHDMIITYHIMDNGLSETNKNEIIKLIERGGNSYHFYDFINFEEAVGYDSKENDWPMATFSRIYLPPILKEKIDRLLYLDVDMLCMGDLSEIYNISLDGCIVAGVQDFASAAARAANNIPYQQKYINAGFLLIDVPKWLDFGATNKIHAYVSERKGRVEQCDQGAINAVLGREAKIVHPKYNAMTPLFFVSSNYIKAMYGIPEYYSESEIRQAKSEPIIIHFLKFGGLVNRPWVARCTHPMKDYYFKYRNMTYWKNVPLENDNKTMKRRIIDYLWLKLPVWILLKYKTFRGEFSR